MKKGLIILNLISIIVVAFGLTTFLHECAHASIAKLVGVDPVLFHTYVSFDSATTTASNEVFILAAGPIFSLTQALLFLAILKKRKKTDFLNVCCLWMSIIGMVVFAGYIIMGPFVPQGDTGKIYAILEIPMYVSLPLGAFSLIGLILFFRKLTPLFVNHLFRLKALSGFKKSKTFFVFFILPLLVSTLINTLISLPAPTLVSIVFPLILPLTLLPSAIRIINSDWNLNHDSAQKNDFGQHTYWPILSMVLVILLLRILTTGINL